LAGEYRGAARARPPFAALSKFTDGREIEKAKQTLPKDVRNLWPSLDRELNVRAAH